MKTYAKRPKETPSAAHKAPSNAAQAGTSTTPSPVTWQAGSVRLPPVFGSRAGGNQAVVQLLAVQRSDVEPSSEPTAEEIHSAAAEGIRTPATTLPFLDRIQASFGQHSIRHIKAHVGPEATKASRAMNALAFASGDHVVFGGTPDLRTAAHEAAHVVQQQAGVRLTEGIGREGDIHEHHADAIADAVAHGQSATAMLLAPGKSATATVQRKTQDHMATLREFLRSRLLAIYANNVTDTARIMHTMDRGNSFVIGVVDILQQQHRSTAEVVSIIDGCRNVPANRLLSMLWLPSDLNSLQIISITNQLCTGNGGLTGVRAVEMVNELYQPGALNAAETTAFIEAFRTFPGTATQIYALANADRFGAACANMIGAGWNAGQLAAFARAAQLTRLRGDRLVDLMNQEHFDARSQAIVGTWGAEVVGSTCADALIVAGGPDIPQVTALLPLAIDAGALTDAVMHVGDQTAPTWNNVIAQIGRFIAHWHSSASIAFDNTSINGYPHLQEANYRINLSLTRGRLNHVKAGHTYQNFRFTYLNCRRGPVSTFFAPNIDVQNEMIWLYGNNNWKIVARQLALDAIVDVSREDQIGNYRVFSVLSSINPATQNRTESRWVVVATFYPINGTEITSENLVAIKHLRKYGI